VMCSFRKIPLMAAEIELMYKYRAFDYWLIATKLIR
jgi:hypothetical protein